MRTVVEPAWAAAHSHGWSGPHRIPVRPVSAIGFGYLLYTR
jgi:hypothetical protein